MKQTFKLIWLSSLLLVFMALAKSAFAQQSSQAGIQISPVTFDFSMDPGSTQSGKFNLRNLNATPMNYSLETELFSKVSNEGAPSFEGAAKPEGVTTLADWISFTEPKEGVIPANDQTDIHFSISVPAGAEPGGHYAAIFAKQIVKDADGKTQLGIASRVGLLVLVSVPGDVSRGAEITSFTSPKFVWSGPIDYKMLVKNNGSVHFDSTAKVELKPLIGKTQTVELGKHVILPTNSRLFEGKWGNKYPFGYYKVTASATDGNGQPMTITTTLWAVPLLIIIPIILLVLIIWAIVAYIKTHFQFVKKSE